MGESISRSRELQTTGEIGARAGAVPTAAGDTNEPVLVA